MAKTVVGHASRVIALMASRTSSSFFVGFITLTFNSFQLLNPDSISHQPLIRILWGYTS